MVVLRIEHTVTDYDAWKAAFDSDPADRKGAGVTAYRIARDTEDPSLVLIDLDFEDQAAAERMHTVLKGVWAGPGMAVMSNVRARIVTVEEAASL